MSINEYVKFMTQTITSYMNQPREERKEQKKQKKTTSSAVSNRWFGILPFAFKLFKRKNSSRSHD
ncbi:YqzE family protein [Lentibacillus saliphilus]|uniref:YqzE family protein n=1 Tax=Lentibacillus saliphilus TaxID=2737028 RepID=UPI001C305E35|nr:YqzE family protein [Lentibacillus saliphilus]